MAQPDSDKPAKPKHAGGRPTSYKPEYCAQIIEWGKQGWSLAEMASALGVAKATVSSDWPAAHPEFSAAVKIARTHSEAYGARHARENWGNPKFNTPLWARCMANLHGWVTDASKQEVTVDAGKLIINAPSDKKDMQNPGESQKSPG